MLHISSRECAGGGAQENTFHTVRLHSTGRYDVDLICGTNTGEEGDLEPEIEAAGIEIIREPDLVREVSPGRDFRALRGLTKKLAGGKYDIVHTHTSKAGFLVISPHADDESFGCAGTMARIKDLGGEVYVMVCSVGDLQHYDGKEEKVTGSTRAHELERVMNYLKVDDYDILYDDAETHMRMDAIPRRDLIAKIERDSKLAYDRLKPTMLAIPVSSYNQDHEAVFRAAFTAARPGVPSIKPFQPLVLGYNNTSLFWSLEREKFHPNFYVDISNYLEQKLTALSMHESQMRDDIHHSSVKNVEYTARLRGSEISVEAAEGYMVFRQVL